MLLQKARGEKARLAQPVMWFDECDVRGEGHYILRGGRVVAEPLQQHLGAALNSAPQPILIHHQEDHWQVTSVLLAVPSNMGIEFCASALCRDCTMLPICGLGGVQFGTIEPIRAHEFHFRKAVLEATVDVIPRLTVYPVAAPKYVHAPLALAFFPQFNKPEDHPPPGI